MVLIGFCDDIEQRSHLKDLVSQERILRIPGGHRYDGSEKNLLNLEKLRRFLETSWKSLKNFAVASNYSVRNSEHEILAGELIEQMTRGRVSLSSSLTSDLNSPRRAYSATLNAKIQALMVELVEAVKKANCGHPGMPMGAADFATVLFSKFLKIDPKVPEWQNRDRLVLSAGHGSMLLYAIHHLIGYKDMTLDQIKNFRQLNSVTPGHPEYGHTLGIETTTGPLGQGISTAVGMAIAERILNSRFGDDIVDHNTYVIASDGDLMEGISHEAIGLAGHLGLSKLIVLYDSNNISIDGSLDLSDSTDQIKRFDASGWSTREIDGHDYAQIEEAIAEELKTDSPSLIACKTTIGFGSPDKAGTSASHGAPLSQEEIDNMKKNLGWDYEPFEIPTDIKDAWRLIGLKNTSERKDWEDRLSNIDDKKKEVTTISTFSSILTKPTDNSTLDVTIRLDNHSKFGNKTNGRVAATYNPSQNLILKIGGGTGFRAPSLYELNTQYGLSLIHI